MYVNKYLFTLNYIFKQFCLQFKIVSKINRKFENKLKKVKNFKCLRIPQIKNKIFCENLERVRIFVFELQRKKTKLCLI